MYCVEIDIKWWLSLLPTTNLTSGANLWKPCSHQVCWRWTIFKSKNFPKMKKNMFSRDNIQNTRNSLLLYFLMTSLKTIPGECECIQYWQVVTARTAKCLVSVWVESKESCTLAAQLWLDSNQLAGALNTIVKHNVKTECVMCDLLYTAVWLNQNESV